MRILLIFYLVLACSIVTAQTGKSDPKGSIPFVSSKDVFGTDKVFIQNIGQYDVLRQAYQTDKILFGYEGIGMPVLFTPTGLVHVQRKYTPKKKKDEEEEERENNYRKEEEDEEEERYHVTERALTLKWIGANANSIVRQEGPSASYFSYGSLPVRAKGFKKLTCRQLYAGIDLQYAFRAAGNNGFEFSATIQPGTDPSLLKWTYSGELKSLKKDAKGNLLVSSSLETTILSAPRAFYVGEPGNRVPVEFKITGNTVQFHLPAGYNKQKTLVIDPFVSNTSNLTGINANIAKDMDFDYEGNIYVSGGGDGNAFKLSKYNASGVLQWTFNGGPITITGSPSWSFGVNYGGFVLDKASGKSYLSQGWNTAGGVRVARLGTDGTYDNFITTPNAAFTEGWRIIWDCNNGTGKMLIAGGGSTSNLDFGIFSPPSVAMTTQNITGLSNYSQDIADAIIDPVTHELYTLFSHGHTSPNNLYKHATPYAVGNIQWNKSTGFPIVLSERRNRPYLVPNALDDNSVNTLALNARNLFYWDGKNLKAFNKATGDPIGTTLTTTDTLLRQGGIIADECDNVFVGTRQGVIKVYKFNGAIFDDAAVPDLSVVGFTGANNNIYDLAYDDARRMLYACGRGFVASFDVSAYCVQATYQVKLTKNCTALSVKAELVPAPPAGSTLDYVLYSNGAEISTNKTGEFSSLALGTNYTIKAFINKACSGIQTSVDFKMIGPAMSIAITPACGSNGSIAITPNGGATPYNFSLNGANFQAGNRFDNLVAGTYNIKVRDALGCERDTVVVVGKGTNCVEATVVTVDEKCALGDGSITVTATKGKPPYTYSIDGVNYQSSNIFPNLAAGNYTVTTKDADNGTFMLPATLATISNNNLTFSFTTTNGSCAGKDGTITAVGSGGTPPLQFAVNSGTFQSAGTFTSLDAGDHKVMVKDANGCIFSRVVNIPLTNTLAVDAGADQTICEGESMVMSATSNGNSFLWTPAARLSNTTILQPKATPVTTTQYHIIARLGPCTAEDSVTIVVKPAPRPFAIDTTICFGQSVTLQAGGGASYTWSPSTYLSSTTVGNPQVSRPASTITYTIHAVGANNCASILPGKVTVTVDYRLRVFAGNDTAALENEAMQLNAIDLQNNPSVNWVWTPSGGLSNPNIPNPVFQSDGDKRYSLLATTPDGCEAQDSLTILVYKQFDIFVPTAFSPNGDGKNEILKAVPFGIKVFKRFAVYNRWGQLVFSTADPSRGWDGKIGGKVQATGTFVWIVSGVDYKGKPIERKGTTVLIQ